MIVLRIIEDQAGSDVAALDAARQQPAQERDRARDQLGVIEFGQLGKSRPLGDQQPQQLVCVGISDQSLVHDRDQTAQQGGGRTVRPVELRVEDIPVG